MLKKTVLSRHSDLVIITFCLQYMGDSTPEKVKMKIVEMLYSWTVAFPNETKISEAYQTLKSQGALRGLLKGL